MEDSKEPQQMLPLRNEGHRELRKRKPERGAFQRRALDRGSSARLAATSHGAGLGERQMVMIPAHFLREGVGFGLSWRAELGVLVRRRPWRGRRETEGGLGHWMVCF